ncbi:hydantoinase/oxoprolinase family protein [Desulforhopalus singaporensis]|uniref:N-methylhydantoinase A n=1 Tax=Desulforhopalus singaporensis TaxID=91360 RepID=A0A1H0U1Y6_9BACT|nr:hydantoinase/oxoprolinase family protein [Desulforhopalus singaporensis]SDP60199.1 N-methylhydantoinase A [Desulforhopalus singaporensis]
MAKFRTAVDTGGTFTDIFVFNGETGEVQVQKVPSTPDNPSRAIANGMEAAGVHMPDVDLFSHGTTVGTNALITRELPPTGMVCTKGFRDVVEIRRSTKQDLWDHYKDVAPPYVKRRHRLEVEERVDYAGTMVTPLNDEEARRVAKILKKRGMKAIAVCFMNAYMSGVNEQRMKEILQEEIPGAYVCTSNELLPEIFEHERFSTCLTNAVLGPVVGDYLNDLTSRLEGMGYRGDVLVLHSGGGVMKAETVAQYASRVASSGIAAGAIAMDQTAKMCGFQNAMGLDMGGTSCDVSLTYEGELRMSKEWEVEFGYPIRYPSIEVITIGAGGGSVAWIDQGGSLRNGPESAGAVPGPACYQAGGEKPTNTDANLVLGRLNTTLLDGRMQLNKEASEKAVKKIADAFDMTTIDAASAVLELANANMCDALRLISVTKGYDPRDFALVAFGGAGPLHAAYVARELEIPKVIVPRYPGVHAALGCLQVDVRHDLTRTYLVNSTDADLADIEQVFAELEQEAYQMLEKEGMSRENIELVRNMDLRYVGQWRNLNVNIPKPIESLDQALQIFHNEHERQFSWSNPDQVVEIYGLRITAIGKVPKPSFARYEITTNSTPTPEQTRRVYFGKAGGFVDTPVYNREKLVAGAHLTGPAIIEQLDTTTVVPTGVKAVVDEYLNIIMDITG